MEKTDWKKEFKDKMSDYSEQPPEGLMNDIFAAYDAEMAGSGRNESAGRKRMAVIVAIAGMAAAAAVAVGVFVTTGAGSGISPNILTESLPDTGEETVWTGPEVTGQVTDAYPETASEKVPAPGTMTLPETETASGMMKESDTETASGMMKESDTETASGTMKESDTETASGTMAENAAPEAGKTVPDTASESMAAEDIVPSGEKEEDVERGQAYGWEDILLADAGKEEVRKRPALNVYASGITGRNSRYSGYSPAVAIAASQTSLKYGSNSLAGIVAMNFSEEVKTDARHYMPVRAGITASWEFAPKWSVESGLTYSWLLSDIRTGSDSYYVDSRQTLHYLGIPLNIGYSFLDSRWIRVYVSAGGMMEKCIGGRVKSDFVHNGDVRNSENDRLTVSPLQWSVAVSAGLQFSITRLVGIYVEPGVSYHFDNGADVQSVYTDKPLNFNMNLGLRFSF